MFQALVGKATRLLTLVQRYPPLVDGAFVIIAWVGFKLCWEYLNQAGVVHFEIPQWISLGLIVVIFFAAFMYARQQERVGEPRKASDS